MRSQLSKLILVTALLFPSISYANEGPSPSLVQYILSVNQPGKPGTFDPKFAIRALIEALSCGDLSTRPASEKINLFKQIFAAISDQQVRINGQPYEGFILKGTSDYQGFIGGLGAWVAIADDGRVVSGRITDFANVQDFVSNAPKTLEELKGLPGNRVNPPLCSADPFESFASGSRPPAVPTDKCVMSTRPAVQLAVASAGAAASAVSQYAQFMAVQAYLGTLKEVFDTATALTNGLYLFGFADSSLTSLPDDWTPTVPERPFNDAAAMTLWFKPASGGQWKPVRANFLLMPQGMTASVVARALINAGIPEDELLGTINITYSPYYINAQGNRVTDVGLALRKFDEEHGCYKSGSLPIQDLFFGPLPLEVQRQLPYTPAQMALATLNAQAPALNVEIQDEMAKPQIDCRENLDHAERLLSLFDDPVECYDIVQYDGVGRKLDLIVDYLNECKLACAADAALSARREELGAKFNEIRNAWLSLGTNQSFCDVLHYGSAPIMLEEEMVSDELIRIYELAQGQD